MMNLVSIKKEKKMATRKTTRTASATATPSRNKKKRQKASK